MEVYYPNSVYFSITLIGLDCTNSRDYNFCRRLNPVGTEGLPGHAFFVFMDMLSIEYSLSVPRERQESEQESGRQT
jgi:hypothetical protein